MPTTWYLSVEWQMFLITPLIAYLLTKRSRISLMILSSLILATCAYTFKVSIEEKFVLHDFDK